MFRGELAELAALFRATTAEAAAALDLVSQVIGSFTGAFPLAFQGDTKSALASSAAALQGAHDLGSDYYVNVCYPSLVVGSLAAGDVPAAWIASETSRATAFEPVNGGINVIWIAEATAAHEDFDTAQSVADTAVSMTKGWWRSLALTVRARVAIALGDVEQAQGDLHEALPIAAGMGAWLCIPDILDLLADLACRAGSHLEAARLFGAADTLWRRMGAARFKVYDADYGAAVAAARDALGQRAFADAWTEGAALSGDEAIAYAQRGRGERGRRVVGRR